MNVKPAAPEDPDPAARDFYVDAMQTLDRAGVPFLVGGAFAMAYFSGITRHTKDLDLLVRRADRDRALTTLTAAGYRTEFFYPFWIAKALSGEAFIDILYNSGNGLCPIDDEWFAHAVPADVLGYRTRLAPAEEQIWMKAFIMDRDRFDGGDVNHLILGQGRKLDWPRLLRRFAGHERVLLSHLSLFGYAYPCERDCIPADVFDRLIEAVRAEPKTREKVCRGTLLAQKGYGPALNDWGFADARIKPHGPLTEEEVAQLPPP